MTGFIFIALLILLALGVPVSAVMVLSAASATLLFSDYSLGMIAQKLFNQSDSFPLIAIPLFVFAGGIMGKGGMSDRLIRLASALVGQVRGGLAMVSVAACMLFAAISGSTAATTAAIGTILIPAVIKTGFSRGAATSLQATAGSIGIIIPPSVPFVLMGIIAEISIGKLFLGGILPGLCTGIALMLTAYAIARIQKHPPSGQARDFRAALKALKESLLSLLTVIFIVGSIMTGIATPTEAAIIAVAWSLFVGGVIYRQILWSDLPAIMTDTVKVTGIVVLCIGATAPFAWLLTIEQVPEQIAAGMLSITSNPVLLKLIILVILLMIGTFLDLTPAMILLVPILKPIAVGQLGMNPVHFGVVMVMALGIGQCTPPVGIALFVASSIAGTRIGELLKPLAPFLLAMLAALLLTTFWAPLSTGLPNLFMK